MDGRFFPLLSIGGFLHVENNKKINHHCHHHYRHYLTPLLSGGLSSTTMEEQDDEAPAPTFADRRSRRQQTEADNATLMLTEDTTRRDAMTKRRDDIIIIIRIQPTRLYSWMHCIEPRLLYRRRTSPGDVRTTTKTNYRRLYHSISLTYRTHPRSGVPFIKRPGETTRRDIRTIDVEGRSINDLERRQQGELFVWSMRRAVQSSDLERREESLLIDAFMRMRYDQQQSIWQYEQDVGGKKIEILTSGTIVKAINQDQWQVWRSSTGMRTVWIMNWVP